MTQFKIVHLKAVAVLRAAALAVFRGGDFLKGFKYIISLLLFCMIAVCVGGSCRA